ncbi:MAG: glycoside hydrolase family 3 N-terminal domain-containing protein [Bacteroidales bacterium]
MTIFKFFIQSLLLIIIASYIVFSSENTKDINDNLRGKSFEPPANFSTPWTDSVLSSLTLEQKIGQLFMIEVSTQNNARYLRRIEKQIVDNNIGGIIFFKGGPLSQIKFTNQLQQTIKTPLMLSMDAEWGLSMRLDSTPSFPRHITLGAIANERLIYELGLEMGWQSKRMGIHMNFAPVIDVNSNPANPVINSRSFGEDRYNVARKGLALMFGMQDAGVFATAKHFPGHGDTETDSHHALPYLPHSRSEIDSVHLFPFRQLIDNGLQSLMIAHLNIPSMDDTPDIPSSLSPKIINHLLKKEMEFKGLVVSDAMNMKGVTSFYPPGELELKALQAGVDLILMPQNLELAINTIHKSVKDNTISEEFIDEKVRKILYFKEMAGLDDYRHLPRYNVYEHLNAPRVQELNRKLVESAITVVHNEDNTIPLRRLDTLQIAALSIGSATENPFQTMLGNYYPVSKYSIFKNHNQEQADQLIEELNQYNLVIVSVQNNSMFPGRNYGINQATINLVNRLSSKNNVILNIFANPYSLSSFGEDILRTKAVIVSYQDGRDYEEASAEIIYGVLGARGRLPVSAVPHFPVYTGIKTEGNLRIRYRDPDQMGIDADMLRRVDSIAMMGIEEEAYPGCQIAVIKDGAMIYHKAFGHHTYTKQKQVSISDIYDLASLTKILATTVSLMKLHGEGKIDLDDPLGKHLPFALGSNKQDLIIREILAHQSKLRSWIPFYLSTLDEGMVNPEIFSTTRSEVFPVQVATDMYIHKNYRDSIFKKLLDSDLLTRKRYIYSDLGFILFAEMIEEITGKPIDQYVKQEFYAPMGLKNITYNPLQYHNPEKIVPTEMDTLFRLQKVHGFVHDPTASMLGGVSGHAGMFSNASDVAIFMQMLLQEGRYGDVEYLKPEVVKEFTRTQFAGNQNRRALGFDKPNIKKTNTRSACLSASPLSFGHSGFTGTYAWADPKENLVYVFLSNRVYPNVSNRKISELDIRTEIQQAIYDAIYFKRFLNEKRIP